MNRPRLPPCPSYCQHGLLGQNGACSGCAKEDIASATHLDRGRRQRWRRCNVSDNSIVRRTSGGEIPRSPINDWHGRYAPRWEASMGKKSIQPIPSRSRQPWRAMGGSYGVHSFASRKRHRTGYVDVRQYCRGSGCISEILGRNWNRLDGLSYSKTESTHIPIQRAPEVCSRSRRNRRRHRQAPYERRDRVLFVAQGGRDAHSR